MGSPRMALGIGDMDLGLVHGPYPKWPMVGRTPNNLLSHFGPWAFADKTTGDHSICNS